MKKKVYINKDEFLHKGIILYKIFGICKVLYRDMFSNKCKITYIFDEYLYER